MRSLFKRKDKISLYCNFSNFSSILKNKDQVGQLDKSYSGTDSSHLMGSNRVLDQEERKKTVTHVIDDSKIHHEQNPNLLNKKVNLDEKLQKEESERNNQDQTQKTNVDKL